MKKWIPLTITLLCALWFISKLSLPKDEPNSFHTTAFGQLPIMANGRFQPMHSLAQNSLLQLREKRRVYIISEKRYLEATPWLMEVMMNPTVANERRTFRIDHPELKSLLKLPDKSPDPNSDEDGKHYSWNQVKPSIGEVESQGKRIGQIDAAKRNHFEKALMKLQERLFIYMRLQNTLQPQDTTDFSAELRRFQELVEPGLAAFRAQQAGQPHDEQVLEEFTQIISRYDVTTRFDPPLLIPPLHPDEDRIKWSRMGEALVEVVHGHGLHYAVTNYAAMSTAYKNNDPARFNQALTSYKLALSQEYKPELKKARSEYFFNHMQAFYRPMIFYVLALLLACVSWFNMSDWMRRSANYLVILAFIIHTIGLIYRMVLEGRPPVTNLYSSAIFIGWGAIILGMIVERFYKDGIGTVAAAAVGFITLVIAHNLSLGGDTMEMMRAVLDTNFWLATHVVIVTLGYASTFFAGFLAILYIVRGLFTRTLSEATGKSLARMVYGIICFATLFSFVGTVLGGIWADQSWGRFWGWDPKENGALIIVLWNALILHARWGGMIRERGLMNMAIVGNIVTSWSWFGVNMLGIGLHSYGFMDAAFKWLMIFVSSQLLLIGLGLLPKNLWMSFRTAPANQ